MPRTKRAAKRPTWKRWICDKLRQLIVDIERGDALVEGVDVRNAFDEGGGQNIDIRVATAVPLIHGWEDHPRTEPLYRPTRPRKLRQRRARAKMR